MIDFKFLFFIKNKFIFRNINFVFESINNLLFLFSLNIIFSFLKFFYYFRFTLIQYIFYHLDLLLQIKDIFYFILFIRILLKLIIERFIVIIILYYFFIDQILIFQIQIEILFNQRNFFFKTLFINIILFLYFYHLLLVVFFNSSYQIQFFSNQKDFYLSYYSVYY
ncbi:hypothetical protein IMG5_005460 [Ichthyophthirius multifiliis]|uniref:Transmembrane protein n=1 Tax=Ichthyophthirius multifiliis TaxID=5932 RepID=G0QJH3_ICHMU|nr:hypothetical protein IMG5_005460 [Ichthyophthirius multifiliis]EGR34624.1 hypothetical protein IMG5_005460 [Ichthyophthirius multifiliis]|eukprot:XP_004039928.1 hypothetical protein IMG5_005460 [Ichthyophthirius multifiliis]